MESGGFCRILSVSQHALCSEADVPQHVGAWCVQLRTHPWGGPTVWSSAAQAHHIGCRTF